MISYIKGEILSRQEKYIILLNNNIGYKIFATSKLLEKLKPGDDIELYTYLKHTEDNMSLFGFTSPDELAFFELLISISGVGPRTALGVLEVAKLNDIKQAILRDDPSILYKVSGVGKKTAERIVVELKNKLDDLPSTGKEIKLDSESAEVFDALSSLGYSDSQIRTALKSIPEDIIKMEHRLKHALKFLGK